MRELGEGRVVPHHLSALHAQSLQCWGTWRVGGREYEVRGNEGWPWPKPLGLSNAGAPGGWGEGREYEVRGNEGWHGSYPQSTGAIASSGHFCTSSYSRILLQ